MTSLWMGGMAGYGIAIPVGAIAVLIVQVGMRCGFRCGASAGAGAATADMAYSLLAVTGGAVVADAVESVETQLRWTSAAVLVTIAIYGLSRSTQPPSDTGTPLPNRTEYARTYAKFLGLTIINPLTVVYFTAFVLGLGLGDDLGGIDSALFVAGAFLASLSWQLLLAGIGAVAHHKLPARFHNTAGIGGNLIVLAMAAVVLLR